MCIFTAAQTSAAVIAVILVIAWYKAWSGEDPEQDRDGDGERIGVRGQPEAHGDPDEGHGDRRGE